MKILLFKDFTLSWQQIFAEVQVNISILVRLFGVIVYQNIES